MRSAWRPRPAGWRTAPGASPGAFTRSSRRPPRAPPRSDRSSSTTRRVLIDELFDEWERAWSGRDPRAFARCCADDVHYEDPLTPLLQGRVRLVAHALQLWEGAPDVRVNRLGERLHQGAYACAPCKVIGTHTGPLGRISATGRAFEVHAVVYAELRDAKLFRVRAFFDAYDAARQLGVLPRQGSPGERALLLLRGFGLRG